MSDFGKVIELITPFLNDYSFLITKSYKNHVMYESTKTSIIVGYDEREQYYFTIVGDKLNISIPLDVNNLATVFHYDTKKFIGGPYEDFFIDFFMSKGNSILLGDRDIFKKLKTNRDQQAEEYTRQLLQRQNLDAADKAWHLNNYREFIRHLDLLDKSSLPKSYELKYTIARKNLNK